MPNLKLFIAALMLSTLALSACNESDPDPCEATQSAEKVVNIQADLIIQSTESVPVANEPFTITIKLIPCSQEEIIHTFTGETDENGSYTTDIVNLVLNNTVDKVEILAVAPDLTNYLTQEFHLVTKKYEDLQSFGLENIELEILTID